MNLAGSYRDLGLVDPSRIRVAAAFEAAGMDPVEPVALFASLAALDGPLSSARRRLVHIGALPPELAAILAEFEVECVPAERVDERVPHLNKLRLLEGHDDVDYVLAVDTDVVLLGDPHAQLRSDAVTVKPVDNNPLPDDAWEALFGAFGQDVPAARYLTTFHASPVPAYFNSGVIGVPVSMVEILRERWLATGLELLERYPDLPDVVAGHAFFTDQFALAIALATTQLPVRALPISCNYPTNEPIHDLHDPDRIEPLILHHHHQIGDDGTLAEPVHAAARAAVREFNRRLTAGGPPEVTFDNRSFWNERYRTDPTLGSGYGSRGELADRKAALIGGIAASIDASSVLDVGCGDLEVVSRATLPDRYVGLDVSDEVVAQNRQRRPDWTFEHVDVGSAEDPGLPVSDLVLCFDVLIHQHDPDTYRRIVRRLLRATGGVGLVSGYERVPESFRSEIVAFHEPITASLAAAGAVDVEIVDEYRDTAVVSFRRPQPVD